MATSPIGTAAGSLKPHRLIVGPRSKTSGARHLVLTTSRTGFQGRRTSRSFCHGPYPTARRSGMAQGVPRRRGRGGERNGAGACISWPCTMLAAVRRARSRGLQVPEDRFCARTCAASTNQLSFRLKLTVFVNAQGFACAGLTVLHSDTAIGSHALPSSAVCSLLLSEALSPFGSLTCSKKSNSSSQQDQTPRLIALSCS